MKNLFIFIVFILVFVFIFVRSAMAQSVDDIINQYIIARGGIDKLNAVTSITFEGTREMMGNRVQVKIAKVQGKLFRTDFEYAGNRGFSIVTPDQGWAYMPVSSYEPEAIPTHMLKQARKELDIMGPLVNYRMKGYQATLQGKKTINCNECHQVQLISPDGDEAFYYIDIKTSLLVQSRQAAESNSQHTEKEPQQLVTNFSNYKDFSGVLFPQTIETESTGVDVGILTFDKIEVNMPVDEKWYIRGN